MGRGGRHNLLDAGIAVMSQHLLPVVREIIAKPERSEGDMLTIATALKWARAVRARSWQAREILSLLGEE